MNEPQIGLLIVTPLVIGVAVALYRQGVMSKGVMMTVSLATVAMAGWVFLAQ